jgi:DNA-binding MarR family transcriptional regulator
MDLDAYRQFRLLTEISSVEGLTQRWLAQKHGLALGLTNFLIRRLVKKGYIKIVNLERKRLRYLITPKGLAEKTRLTYEYLEYSMALFRQSRALMTDTLVQMMRAGGTKAVLCGTGELAEVAFLAMQERGLQVVGVLQESGNGKTMFMNQPVRSLGALSELTFDWIVIATFKDHRKLIQQLQLAGIRVEQIVTIPASRDLGRLATQHSPMIGAPALSVEEAQVS